MTGYRFETMIVQIWRRHSTSLPMRKMKHPKGSHLPQNLCGREQAGVWNPNDPALYLLVKGVSFFLTIKQEKRVWRGTTANMEHDEGWKQERSAGVWRQIGPKTKPLSHSDNSVVLTPSISYDYKDLTALRGPADPPTPIRGTSV